jgi:hypothetical protein
MKRDAHRHRCAGESFFAVAVNQSWNIERDQRGAKPTVWSLHLFSFIFARGFPASQGATAHGWLGAADFPDNPESLQDPISSGPNLLRPQSTRACRRLRRAAEPSGVERVPNKKGSDVPFFRAVRLALGAGVKNHKRSGSWFSYSFPVTIRAGFGVSPTFVVGVSSL